MPSNAVDSAVRSQVKPAVSLAIVFASTFSLLWLAVEPLAVFGLDDDLKDMGLRGYFGLVGLAAAIATVVVLIRYLQAYRRAAIAPTGSAAGPTMAELITQDSDAADTALDATMTANPTDTLDVDHPNLPYTERLLLAGVLRYLRRLGLITTEHETVRATSSSARTALAQLADHAVHQQGLGGDWRARAPADKEARRGLLSAVEHSRELRGGTLPPVRFTTSVIILLTTVAPSGETRVLTHRSASWGTAYDWFIGGIVEPEDADLEAAARRELWEETGIEPTKVISIRPLATVHDERVSSRVKVRTKYTYEIFHCAVTTGVELPYPSGKVTFVINGKTLVEHLSWSSAHDLAASTGLQRDAPELTARMSALMATEPASISYSQLRVGP
jgi:8-oxo-dGTP pyrophosphatase MutT (NUDIX family)